MEVSPEARTLRGHMTRTIWGLGLPCPLESLIFKASGTNPFHVHVHDHLLLLPS